jgi:hypothetical protein
VEVSLSCGGRFAAFATGSNDHQRQKSAKRTAASMCDGAAFAAHTVVIYKHYGFR